jgi:hypothetical protein
VTAPNELLLSDTIKVSYYLLSISFTVVPFCHSSDEWEKRENSMKKAFLFSLLFLGPEVITMTARTCPPGPPVSRYDGTTEGTTLPGGSLQFNFEYAQVAGFDCFERQGRWYPLIGDGPHSISPNNTVLNMAYAVLGSATFYNVIVPSTDNYRLNVRYAYDFGFFPGITDRPEGIAVNGVVITYDMHFPITYSFQNYAYSSMVVPLNAGKNTIQMFNVTNHGVARLDTMIVTPLGSTPCSDAPTVPGGVSATPGFGRKVHLKWADSTWPSDCTARYYNVFRGTSSGFIPSTGNQIASGLTTRLYTDVTVSCGTTYYYLLEAVDTAGASASAQVSAKIGACTRINDEPVAP